MNGYFEITLNGQKIGLKFGMRALRQIQEKSADVDLFDKSKDPDGNEVKTLSEFGIAYILFAGYCNFCLVKEKKPVFTFQDFNDHVEQAIFNENTEEIRVAVTEFTSSQAVAPKKKEEKEEEQHPADAAEKKSS